MHVYLTVLYEVWQKMTIPHCKKNNYKDLLALSLGHRPLLLDRQENDHFYLQLWLRLSCMILQAAMFLVNFRISMGSQ